MHVPSPDLPPALGVQVQVRARFHKDDTLVAGLTFHSAYTEGALEPESGIWSAGGSAPCSRVF